MAFPSTPGGADVKAKDNKRKEIKMLLSLTERTKFTMEDLRDIAHQFKTVASSISSKLPRGTFRDLLRRKCHIVDPFVAERFFQAFDERKDGAIDFAEFVTSLSQILRGSEQDKIQFCYRFYAVENPTAGITAHDVFLMLKAGLDTIYERDVITIMTEIIGTTEDVKKSKPGLRGISLAAFVRLWSEDNPELLGTFPALAGLLGWADPAECDNTPARATRKMTSKASAKATRFSEEGGGAD